MRIKMANQQEVSVNLNVNGEPLSPAARIFHSPSLDFYIIAVLGVQTSINPNFIKMGLEHTLIKHPRFSSKMVVDDKKGGKMSWIPTTVDLDYHVMVPDLDPNIDSPDQFVEDYISNLTTTPMDLSKPQWEVHLLNIKTSDAEAVGIFRIHHSMGDGSSLISLLLACCRKTSDPDQLPTVPVQKRAKSNRSSGFWRFLLAVWLPFRLILNTMVDFMLLVATVIYLKDTKTPIRGAHRDRNPTPKRFVHRTVSLDDIKLVKNALDTTINDVLLGVTQAALSRYLNRRYGEDHEKSEEAKQTRSYLPKNIRFRATIPVNIRPTAGIPALADMMAKNSKVKWGNWFGYIFLPITIALQDDPLDYVRKAKAIIDRKKLSLGAICSFSGGQFVSKLFGSKAAAAMTVRSFSSTTIAFSNVVGPLEDISFYGHPIAYIAPSVYGIPHALTILFQSYVNKLTIVLAVDNTLIPDPHRLCDDLEESLKLIKDAVIEKK